MLPYCDQTPSPDLDVSFTLRVYITEFARIHRLSASTEDVDKYLDSVFSTVSKTSTFPEVLRHIKKRKDITLEFRHVHRS